MKIARGHYVPKELITSEAVHEAVVKVFVAAGFHRNSDYVDYRAKEHWDCIAISGSGVICWSDKQEKPLTLQQLFTADNGLQWPDWAESVISCGGDCIAFVGDDVWEIISGKMLGFEAKMPLVLATRQPKEKEVKSTELDRFIISENGVWPYVATAEFMSAGTVSKDEFELRSKELGFIGKYRWGVEHPTNGKRPDLPGTLFVKYQHKTDGEWLNNPFPVDSWAWEETSMAFKIVDEAYKPTDTSYLNASTQAQSLTHSEEGLTHGDSVKNPKHYQVIEGVESITIIASAMTVEQWHGFCLGNILKYRIRAGKKGDLQQDIAKADYYQELYEMHKHLCRDAS